MSLYKKLQELSKKENIIAGVGSAEPFNELKEYLKDKNVPFVSCSLDERTEPNVTMANVKSIVAVGLPYNVVYTKIKDNTLRGCISAGAVGTDYHIVIMEKMKKIKDEILPDCEVKMFSDTGPLSDRDVAIRCGIGVRGKNGSVINSKIGGMFFIGYMLTDAEYDMWQVCYEEKISCNNCMKCINACPNGAINDGRCNYSKCISYITQKKGVLNDKEYESIGRQIYGCDICQRVCPFNKNFVYRENEFAYPDIEKLLNMTNREFKEIFGNTAAGWRGKRTLQRNALVVLGNIGDKRALNLIKRYTDSEYDDLRSAAIYAKKKIEES